MVQAIQEAYYLRAMNPSETEVLVGLAGELGLDRVLFESNLRSEMVDSEFRHQLALRDRLGVRSFPSLVLVHESKRVRITHDYDDYRTTLGEIVGRLG